MKKQSLKFLFCLLAQFFVFNITTLYANNTIEHIPTPTNATKETAKKSSPVSLYNFFLASQIGDVSMLERFIKQGADINMVDTVNSNALMIAVLNNQVESAKILIQNGININHVNKYDATAFWYAMNEKNKKMLQLLLDNGANTSVQKNEIKSSINSEIIN